MSPEVNPNAHALLDQIVERAGFCYGAGKNGEVCVMQAINLAERGLSDARGVRDITDTAECVSSLVRGFLINLNDTNRSYGYYGIRATWSSPAARGKGLLKLAHAALGSDGIDESAFARNTIARYIGEILPISIRAIAGMSRYANHEKSLLAAASACEKERTPQSARAAADAARAARRNPVKPAAVADADADAVAAAAAAAVAAAVAAAAADAVAAAVADAVAAAAADAAFLDRYRVRIGEKSDEMLTRCANITAEEIEIAKGFRDTEGPQA